MKIEKKVYSEVSILRGECSGVHWMPILQLQFRRDHQKEQNMNKVSFVWVCVCSWNLFQVWREECGIQQLQLSDHSRNAFFLGIQHGFLPGPHSSVTFLHWQPWEIEIQWVKDAQANVVHEHICQQPQTKLTQHSLNSMEFLLCLLEQWWAWWRDHQPPESHLPRWAAGSGAWCMGISGAISARRLGLHRYSCLVMPCPSCSRQRKKHFWTCWAWPRRCVWRETGGSGRGATKTM